MFMNIFEKKLQKILKKKITNDFIINFNYLIGLNFFENKFNKLKLFNYLKVNQNIYFLNKKKNFLFKKKTISNILIGFSNLIDYKKIFLFLEKNNLFFINININNLIIKEKKLKFLINYINNIDYRFYFLIFFIKIYYSITFLKN